VAAAGRSAQHAGAGAPAPARAAADCRAIGPHHDRRRRPRIGDQPGLASHHLHQLAKYGFVEQVGGSDNRERPWRLVATSLSHEGLDEKPAGVAAVAVYEQVVAERALESFLDWQERRSNWSAGWRAHSGMGNSTVYLTEDELAGLVGAFEQLIVNYIDKRPLDDLASRPPGTAGATAR
jgi:hypothetical protein